MGYVAYLSVINAHEDNENAFAHITEIIYLFFCFGVKIKYNY